MRLWLVILCVPTVVVERKESTFRKILTAFPFAERGKSKRITHLHDVFEGGGCYRLATALPVASTWTNQFWEGYRLPPESLHAARWELFFALQSQAIFFFPFDCSFGEACNWRFTKSVGNPSHIEWTQTLPSSFGLYTTHRPLLKASDLAGLCTGLRKGIIGTTSLYVKLGSRNHAHVLRCFKLSD